MLRRAKYWSNVLCTIILSQTLAAREEHNHRSAVRSLPVQDWMAHGVWTNVMGGTVLFAMHFSLTFSLSISPQYLHFLLSSRPPHPHRALSAPVNLFMHICYRLRIAHVKNVLNLDLIRPVRRSQFAATPPGSTLAPIAY